MDIDDRPTVRSIAVHAGVSASTVSRALKGDPARLPRNSRPHHGHRTRARLHPQRYRAVAGHSLQWRDRRRARPGAGPLLRRADGATSRAARGRRVSGPCFCTYAARCSIPRPCRPSFSIRWAAADGDTVPLAVGRWYDFPEFGGYLGNVGQTSDRLVLILGAGQWRRGRIRTVHNPIPRVKSMEA